MIYCFYFFVGKLPKDLSSFGQTKKHVVDIYRSYTVLNPEFRSHEYNWDSSVHLCFLVVKSYWWCTLYTHTLYFLNVQAYTINQRTPREAVSLFFSVSMCANISRLWIKVLKLWAICSTRYWQAVCQWEMFRQQSQLKVNNLCNCLRSFWKILAFLKLFNEGPVVVRWLDHWA